MPNFSKKAALRLFEYFNSHSLYKAGSQHTGCDLRAHITASKLRKSTGLPVKKVWCWAEQEGATEAHEVINSQATIAFFAQSLDGTETDEVRYNYHVAAFVETPAGEKVVYDPVFYDGPVALEQWRDDFSSVNGLIKRVVETPAWITDITEARKEEYPARPSLLKRFKTAADARAELNVLRKPSNDNTPFVARKLSHWRKRQP